MNLNAVVIVGRLVIISDILQVSMNCATEKRSSRRAFWSGEIVEGSLNDWAEGVGEVDLLVSGGD